MLDRNVFMETLRDVAEIVRTAAEPLEREEILSYFKDMNLTKEQEDMVFTYLSTPHEDEVAEPVEEQEEVVTVPEADIEESKVFQMYMEDIALVSVPSEDTLKMDYVKLLTGDESVISTISTAWLMTVVNMAKEYFNNAINLEDVIQEGNMALFIRLKELCGSKAAVDVEAELAECVRTAMKDYISEITGEEDSEEIIAGKANLINEAVKYLKGRNGAMPTEKEIAEYTHMDEEELSDIMNMIKNSGVSK